MSDSQVPVSTSRMKPAPVATAMASAQRASHRKSTPKARSRGAHSVTTRDMTAAAKAILECRYRPYRVADQARRVWAAYRIAFSLY